MRARVLFLAAALVAAAFVPGTAASAADCAPCPLPLHPGDPHYATFQGNLVDKDAAGYFVSSQCTEIGPLLTTCGVGFKVTSQQGIACGLNTAITAVAWYRSDATGVTFSNIQLTGNEGDGFGYLHGYIVDLSATSPYSFLAIDIAWDNDCPVHTTYRTFAGHATYE